MQAKITLTTVHESFGATGRRYHQDDSELVAEERGGHLIISVKEGRRRAPEDAPAGMQSTPEGVGAIRLSRDEVRALAAFLAALPDDE